MVSDIPDFTAVKIEKLLSDFKDKQLVLEHLKLQKEFLTTKSKTMASLGSLGVQRTLIELVLWLIATLIFIILQLYLYRWTKLDKPGRAEKQA